MDIDLFGHGVRLDTARIAESGPEIRRQLRAYESGERTSFDLEIALPDTFSGMVWRRVCDIEYGETRTYGALAAELGTAPVAVGGANARNPLPVVVPCHRVVGTDSLRGYRYPGLKETLLRHENGVDALGFDPDGSV